MKGAIKKLLIFIGVIAVVCVAIWLSNFKEVENFSEKYAGADLTAEVDGLMLEGTYTGYQNEHKDAAMPQQSVEIDVLSYKEATGVETYEGNALYTEIGSNVTWEVDVPESGFYNLYMEYLTVESRGVPAERTLKINGEIPFDDAANITFGRIWTDKSEPIVDNQGNQIRPMQVEIYDWQSVYFKDGMGYEIEPYRFYFEKGKNTITLEGVNEPMIIRTFTLAAVEETASYEEYHAQGGAPATGEGLTYVAKIEGEDSVRRSESSLYAKYDKASANTSRTA